MCEAEEEETARNNDNNNNDKGGFMHRHTHICMPSSGRKQCRGTVAGDIGKKLGALQICKWSVLWQIFGQALSKPTQNLHNMEKQFL